jgi:hypothetical protein
LDCIFRHDLAERICGVRRSVCFCRFWRRHNSGTFFVDTSLQPRGPGYSGEMPDSVPSAAGVGVCEKAVASASAGRQLPPGLLSGVKPWPWTIDANGTGYVYASLQSAMAAALRV